MFCVACGCRAYYQPLMMFLAFLELKSNQAIVDVLKRDCVFLKEDATEAVFGQLAQKSVKHGNKAAFELVRSAFLRIEVGRGDVGVLSELCESGRGRAGRKGAGQIRKDMTSEDALVVSVRGTMVSLLSGKRRVTRGFGRFWKLRLPLKHTAPVADVATCLADAEWGVLWEGVAQACEGRLETASRLHRLSEVWVERFAGRPELHRGGVDLAAVAGTMDEHVWVGTGKYGPGWQVELNNEGWEGEWHWVSELEWDAGEWWHVYFVLASDMPEEFASNFPALLHERMADAKFMTAPVADVRRFRSPEGVIEDVSP